jgi:hypothetical protein
MKISWMKMSLPPPNLNHGAPNGRGRRSAQGYNEGGDTDEDSVDDDDEFVMDSDPPETARRPKATMRTTKS